MRVAHKLTAHHDGVGLAGGNDLLGLRGFGDEPDGVDGHVAFAAHDLGKRHLVPGADLDAGAHEAARRNVEEVGAGLLRPSGDDGGVVLVPAPDPRSTVTRVGEAVRLKPVAVDPVGGREAHENGHVDDRAHGAHDVEQQARAILEAAAPLVVARVRQR